jgi:hypothetical protein
VVVPGPVAVTVCFTVLAQPFAYPNMLRQTAPVMAANDAQRISIDTRRWNT